MADKLDLDGPKDECVICLERGGQVHYATPVDNEYGPNHYRLPGQPVRTLDRNAPVCAQDAKYTF